MEDRIRTLHYREPDIRPPLDIVDVLRTSVGLLVTHPWLTLGIAIAVLGPGCLRDAFRPEGVDVFVFMGESPLYLVAVLVDTFIAPAVVGGVAALVAVAAHTKRPVVAREALRRLVVRLPAAIAATSLSTLAMIAGAFFCIVPGIIVSLATSLVVCVTVVEDTGPIAALPRSAELTKGIRVPLIGVAFAAFLPSIATFVPFALIAGADPMTDAFASPITAALAIAQALMKTFCVTLLSIAFGVVYARAAIAPPDTGVAEVAAVFA